MNLLDFLNRRRALKTLKGRDTADDVMSAQEIQALNAAVSGLDAAQGLRFCVDSRSFLLEMLREYAHSRKDEELARLVRAGDMRGTVICAHSLKSMSRTVGLVKLAECSARLQHAAERNSAADVRRAASRTIRLFRKTAAQIKRLPDAEGSST